MSAQERLEAGIWEALLYRPKDFDLDKGVQIESRIAEDNIRENFFKEEILRTAQISTSQNILVLCGDAHTEALKAKLESPGIEVFTTHDLITEKTWR